MKQLHPEQEYVMHITEKLRITTKLVYHPIATDTCYEKAALLGWEFGRVIKALYFRNDGHAVGIVVPELGRRVPLAKVLCSALSLSQKQARSYQPQGAIPSGMEPGTCSPFPLESSIGQEVHDIIVCDSPDLSQKIIDVSVGGRGEEAHRTSLHLPYDAIFTILEQKFGRKIHQIPQETFL